MKTKTKTTNAALYNFNQLSEPCRMITDCLAFLDYKPQPEDSFDGYVSVEILSVQELPDHAEGWPQILVAFHDYGHPQNEHTVVIAYADRTFLALEIK